MNKITSPVHADYRAARCRAEPASQHGIPCHSGTPDLTALSNDCAETDPATSVITAPILPAFARVGAAAGSQIESCKPVAGRRSAGGCSKNAWHFAARATTCKTSGRDRVRRTSGMRIGILSDLHVDVSELPPITIGDDVDAVIIAGDTCEGSRKAFGFLRRVICNPGGYHDGNPGFDPHLTLEIES
jgi:hypothetical protein